MNRRSFIGTVLALGAAPAIVRASSLMPINQSRWSAAGAVLVPVYGMRGMILDSIDWYERSINWETLEAKIMLAGSGSDAGGIRRIWADDKLIYG